MKENYQTRGGDQASAGVRTTLDDTASVQIMKAIIELYAKPGEAILREITSNAWDSHQLAGQTRPVEVTLPDYNSRELIIEDFGIGLNWADIPNAFAKIGFSTKRNNNQQRGSFGFGAKSPILLSDRFTITAVKNGERTIVECRKDADGIGELFLQVQDRVDAPNGVKLTIPLKNMYRFDEEEILTNFFIGWNFHSIKISGQFPKRCLHDETQFEPLSIAENTIGWVSKERHNGTNTRLFASFLGVIYPLKYPSYYDAQHAAYEKLKNYGHLVYLDMPAASVEVTPSREELQYTDVTNNALKVAMEGVIRAIEMQTQQQIDLAPTREAALHLYVEAVRAHLWLAQLTYRGEKIPTSITVRDGFINIHKQERKKSSNTFNSVSDMSGKTLDIVRLAARETILVKVDDIADAAGLRRKFSLFHEGWRKTHPTEEQGNKIEVFFHTSDVTGSWLAAAASGVLSADEYTAVAKAGRETYTPESKQQTVKRFMVADTLAAGSMNIRVTLLTADEIRERAQGRPIVRIAYGTDRIARVATHRNLRNYRSIKVKSAGRLVMRTLQETAYVVYTENITMSKAFAKAFPEHADANEYMRALADAEYTRVKGSFDDAGIAAVLKDYNHLSWRRNYSFAKFAKALAARDMLPQVQHAEFRDLLHKLVQPVPADTSYNKELLDWFNLNPRVTAENKVALARAETIMKAFMLFPMDTFEYTEAKLAHVLTYLNHVVVPEPEQIIVPVSA